MIDPGGGPAAATTAAALVGAQRHRGPDAQDVKVFADGRVALGVDRLRIVDLDPQADGILSTPDGRWHLAYNGEVYNHVELRAELRDQHEFRTTSDAEVVLAAWARWGPACLHRLIGMFALLVWDDVHQELHAARDRFGVKPLHVHQDAKGRLVLASEVAALLAAGVPSRPDLDDWARHLATGATSDTFWTDVEAVAAGTHRTWAHQGTTTRGTEQRWYDLVDIVGDGLDHRTDDEVGEHVATLLAETTRLRFRADVAVGVALSSGLDSGMLLGLIDRTPGAAPRATAFTFTTGDPAYDEDDEVDRLLRGSHHALHRCRLSAAQVPDLAADLHRGLRQPFGGLPTLAYGQVFARARAEGVLVVLDGQGLDEAWAGYDYYALHHRGDAVPVVQGGGAALRPDCVLDSRLPPPAAAPDHDFPDPVRRLQRRDLLETKLPRALRYNDAVSMRSSVELREPFLDHRLVELALRQPSERTLGRGEGKALLRRLAPRWRPATAPPVAAKRPVQTPQREWLRGPLRPWADQMVASGLERFGGVLVDADRLRGAWSEFLAGEGGNANAPWQWISLGLEAEAGG